MLDRSGPPLDTSTEEPRSRPRRKLAGSPLAVVGLFFGLSELGLGYGAGAATGWVQVGVLAFMALFATGIVATFFVFLWKRPWVFYPPSEFSVVPVERYVGAMRGNPASVRKMAVESVSAAFQDEALARKLDLTGTREEQRQGAIERIIDEVRTNAVRNLDQRVLHVDARPLGGKYALHWDEPYDADMPVHVLLDRISFLLQPLPPYPYGTIWLLKDASFGRVFDDIGPAWASNAGVPLDTRAAREVGITGGMTLEVVPGRR